MSGDKSTEHSRPFPSIIAMVADQVAGFLGEVTEDSRRNGSVAVWLTMNYGRRIST